MAREFFQDYFSETRPYTPAPGPDPSTRGQVYQLQARFDITLDKAVQNYDYLTFPSIRQQVINHLIPFDQPLLVILARFQGQAIGMVLAQLQDQTRSASLRSISVLPEYRRQGIGNGMLSYLEEVLARKGYQHLEFIYQTNWSSHPMVAPVLEKRGWTVRPHQLLLRITREQLAQVPVLQQYRLSPEFTPFPWNELTPQERQLIQERQARENWYPAQMDPFQCEPFIEPHSSIGLRYQEQVIGWKIHHRFTPDTVRKLLLFLSPEFRGQGVGVALLVESLRRYLDSRVPFYSAEVEIENARMVSWWQRHLVPYLAELIETHRAEKQLLPQRDE